MIIKVWDREDRLVNTMEKKNTVVLTTIKEIEAHHAKVLAKLTGYFTGKRIKNAWFETKGTQPAPRDVLFLDMENGELIKIEAGQGQLYAKNLCIKNVQLKEGGEDKE